MYALSPGVLFVSTATASCTKSVQAAFPCDMVACVHRPLAAEPPDSLSGLAQGSGSTIILAGRGLRACELLRVTADSAIRAGRPCLFLYHAGAISDLNTPPPGCEAQPYKTSREAASKAAAFVSQRRASTFRVFAIDNAWSRSWNAALTASIQHTGAMRIVPSAITKGAFEAAAREADITIVMPGCRKVSLADHLAQVACDASSKAGRRWLYIRSSRVPTSPEYVAARPPGCELAVCASREDVAQAVDDFIGDSMAC